MAYSGAGTVVPSTTAANTYAASQNAISVAPVRRFSLIADCPSPSAQGRSGVRIRVLARAMARRCRVAACGTSPEQIVPVSRPEPWLCELHQRPAPELADLLMRARASVVTLACSQRAFRSEGGTTMSDLIVIGYPDEETAQNVWDELMKLERDYLVDLEDAAIIRRDQKGKLHITTPAHHAVAWGSLSGLFWGVLLGLIFVFPLAPLVGVAGGIMGGALGAAENLGIKGEFKQRVQDMAQPGTSAILVILRKATYDKFVEALRPYGGTILRTSLPHEAEQQLMKILHGEDLKAPTWQQPTA